MKKFNFEIIKIDKKHKRLIIRDNNTEQIVKEMVVVGKYPEQTLAQEMIWIKEVEELNK